MAELAITLPLDVAETLAEATSFLITNTDHWDAEVIAALELAEREIAQIKQMTGGANGPETQDQA